MKPGTLTDSHPLPQAAAATARRGAAARPRYRRLNGNALAALIVLGLVVAFIVVGPLLYRVDPTLVTATQRLRSPSPAYLMGTDQLGRDVLARVMTGGQQSLRVATVTMIITIVVGSAAGLIAAWVRALDNVVMRISDAFMALPAVILAIALMALREPSESSVIIALSVVYIPRVARMVRGKALVIREIPFVEAAAALGAGATRIMARHILPSSVPEIIVQATFIFGYAVLDEATLSFLGVGPPPPAPSWGNMLAEARYLIRDAFWISFFPGLLIGVAVLSTNILGDGIRDAYDVKRG
jgi:peptide/nickel transport system permease protein